MSKKYEIIYNDLCRQIKENILLPGAKISTEMQLAEQYNCSRITVITALKKLKDENMLYSVKKSGTFVNGSTKLKRVRIVALILPFDNDFSLDIIDETQKYALLNNIFISVFSSGNNTNKEHEILTSILGMQVDGIIIYPCGNNFNADVLSAFIVKNIPLVFLDRAVLGINAPLITSDNQGGMQQITEFLLSCGHRNIGFFSAYDSALQTVKDRFLGYCTALTNNKITINYAVVQLAQDAALTQKITSQKKLQNFIKECAQKYYTQYQSLQAKPTAVCCVNDYCAFELKTAFSEVKNITITGFDQIKNLPGGNIITAQQNFRLMATVALQTLIDYQQFTKNQLITKIPTALQLI